MWNPTALKQFERRSHEGVSRTKVIEFSSEHGADIYVERPLGLVQRSYCDIRAHLRAERSRVYMTIPGDFHRNQHALAQYIQPHHAEDIDISFPLIEMTKSIVFKPDRASQGEFVESEPRILHKLNTLLSDPDQYALTTKTEISAGLWKDQTDAQVDESTFPEIYRYRYRDRPNETCLMYYPKTGAFFPSDIYHAYNKVEGHFGANLDHIDPKTHFQVTRSGDTFRLEDVDIRVDVRDVCANSYRLLTESELEYKDSGDNRYLHFIVYTLRADLRDMTESGFCEFPEQSHHLIYEGFELSDDTGFLRFYYRDSDDHADELVTMGALLSSAILQASKFQLRLPNVRFTPNYEYSLHGPNIETSRGIHDYVGELEDKIVSPFNWGSFLEFEPDTRNTPTWEGDFDVDNLKTECFRLFNAAHRGGGDDLWRWDEDDDIFPFSSDADVEATFVNELNTIDGHGRILVHTDDVNGGEVITEIDGLNQIISRHNLMIVSPDGEELRYITKVVASDIEYDQFMGQSTFANHTQFNAAMGNTLDEDTKIDLVGSFYLGQTLNYTENHTLTETDPDGRVVSSFCNVIDSADAGGHTNYLIQADYIICDTIADNDDLVFLFVGNKTKYVNFDDQNVFSAYYIDVEHHTIQGADRISLKLYDRYGTRVNATTKVERQDLHLVIIPPAYKNYFDGTLEDLAGVDNPLSEVLDEMDEFEYGARKIGNLLECSDPCLCPPLGLTPAVSSMRPVDFGCNILPPRLGTYNIGWRVNNPTNITDRQQKKYDLYLDKPTLRLACEYLSKTGDQLENLHLYVPKMVKQDLSEGVQRGVRYPITLREGAPHYVYIEKLDQDPGPIRFQFYYRDKECPVLMNATNFDYFKMIQRVKHPRCNYTYKDWVADRRPILFRWEELGIWGATDEKFRYFELEFAIIDSSSEFMSGLKVYYFNENHQLESSEKLTKFSAV